MKKNHNFPMYTKLSYFVKIEHEKSCTIVILFNILIHVHPNKNNLIVKICPNIKANILYILIKTAFSSVREKISTIVSSTVKNNEWETGISSADFNN